MDDHLENPHQGARKTMKAKTAHDHLIKSLADPEFAGAWIKETESALSAERESLKKATGELSQTHLDLHFALRGKEAAEKESADWKARAEKAEANADFLRKSIGECHMMISRKSSEYQIEKEWESTDLPPRLQKIMKENESLKKALEQSEAAKAKVIELMRDILEWESECYCKIGKEFPIPPRIQCPPCKARKAISLLTPAAPLADGERGILERCRVRELRDRCIHFYMKTDGSFEWPNNREGDMLRMVFNAYNAIRKAAGDGTVTEGHSKRCPGECLECLEIYGPPTKDVVRGILEKISGRPCDCILKFPVGVYHNEACDKKFNIQAAGEGNG